MELVSSPLTPPHPRSPAAQTHPLSRLTDHIMTRLSDGMSYTEYMNVSSPPSPRFAPPRRDVHPPARAS